MADIELNKLGVKSDSLPDDWLVTLVNPTTGTVAENMTVARFVELLTGKHPGINYSGHLNIEAYKDAGYGYEVDGWPMTGPAICFGAPGYYKQIIGPYGSNSLFIRTINNNIPGEWAEFALNKSAYYALESNSLTDTKIEKIPKLAEMPMTLKETGESTLATETIERYEYNISKMAEAILELQKQVADLKSN